MKDLPVISHLLSALSLSPSCQKSNLRFLQCFSFTSQHFPFHSCYREHFPLHASVANCAPMIPPNVRQGSKSRCVLWQAAFRGLNVSHRELNDLYSRVSDACLKELCPAESKAGLPSGPACLSDLPPFVRRCLWPFLSGPSNVASQWPLCPSGHGRRQAARMDPVKEPNLWLSSSLRVRARRRGIRACEIITALNLWSRGQLVTADSRLKVIRPYLSLVLSLSLSPSFPLLPYAFSASAGL